MKHPCGPDFVLGVDLDNSMADYEGGMRRRVARMRGISSADLPPVTDWGLAACGWFATQEEYLAAHIAAVNDGLYGSLPIYPGAADMLRELRGDGVRVRIITAREATLVRSGADTFWWLDRHRVEIDDIAFTGDKAGVEFDLIVEDSPPQIESIRAAGREVLIYDQPYNRYLDGPRAYDWYDVADEVRARLAIRRLGAA